jgi:protoporphyrinogen oxidase
VEWRRFDRVVSTLPTRLTVRLIPQLPEDFRGRYEWGEAYGAHCLILALDRQVLRNGEYWVNLNDPGYPFLVLVEHTNYLPPAEYGGRHLVYLGNYLPMDHPLFRASKEDVLAEFLPALRRIVPDFRDEWVQQSWVFSAPYAQPIVTRDYPEHIPPLKAPLPDLWLGSMFQVYPQDRGQNYSVALAERLADAIAREP